MILSYRFLGFMQPVFAKCDTLLSLSPNESNQEGHYPAAFLSSFSQVRDKFSKVSAGVWSKLSSDPHPKCVSIPLTQGQIKLFVV